MQAWIEQLKCAVKRLARDDSGAVLLEYAVVTVIGVSIAVALLALGTGMVSGFSESLNVLYGEYP